MSPGPTSDSQTAEPASPPAAPSADPLAALAELPGVPAAVAGVREAVDAIYGHRVMRRRSPEVSAEAALRGARASAALAGADWPLEEVRRRSDFGATDDARTVGAALRLTAEAGESLSIWRSSPLRVLARLHLVAAAEPAPRATPDSVGRPRVAGEAVAEPALAELPTAPEAEEVAARLEALSRLVVAGSSAPALVLAAIVQGELLALRPFVTHNGLVARAAARVVLVGGGLDPKAVTPAELGHAEQGRDTYLDALGGYLAGTPAGVAGWIAHCARAVELGARESTAVCEALQRGAA
ncbi:oxidoreductase [Streptomyces sp. NBRC 109706]|uniref:oxidoreductase n=1 Tax=Streptomyces sp. NBRC 109706 TaxID=1550035 RepID=UPI000AFCD929|nr:oxidoreductase [Streptomyces sp. NBRC 109706]